jgi:NitT/TauT family transport system substrate-binding protein
MLLAAIADVQAGREPPFVLRTPETNPVADLDALGVVLPTSKDWREFWNQHWHALRNLAVILLLAVGLACAPAAPVPSSTAAAPPAAQSPAESLAPAQPAQIKPIRVGIATASMSYLLQRIAEVKGFYREEGFDPELVIIIQQGPVALASLAAGELQYAHFAGSGARAAATGLPVRVVQCPGVKPFYRVVLAPGVKSLKEVEGRPFSVATLGTTPHLIGRDILKQHGVDTDKVEFLASGDAAVRYAGLQTGQIAGGVVAIPEAIRAAKDGLTVASTADDLPAFCDGGLVVTVDTIANNRAEVTRYITAMHKAVKFLQANLDESARVLGEWAELDDDVAAETIRLAQVNSSFSTEKQLAQDAIESVLKQAIETGSLKQEVPLSAVADLSMYP